LPAWLLDCGDGTQWSNVIMCSLDENENALYPEAFPKEMLIKLRDFSPYVFASQHQQNPIPAGGALFKPNYFTILDEEPEMITTFITADTAETDKDYNDKTVFSFFGLYKIAEKVKNMSGKGYQNYKEDRQEGIKYGLHWIDCVQLQIEPKDLRDAFMDFYIDCNRYKYPPLLACIEKKSSGSTLISVLDSIRGIEVRDIKREAKKSKTQRFLDIQPFVYSKFISFPEDARHIDMCVTHMSKITANNSHRFDDIADTLADAVRVAYIDKSLNHSDRDQSSKDIAMAMNLDFSNKLSLIRKNNNDLFRR
jgi:predicted phage terminase large subunit-like protein